MTSDGEGNDLGREIHSLRTELEATKEMLRQSQMFSRDDQPSSLVRETLELRFQLATVVKLANEAISERDFWRTRFEAEFMDKQRKEDNGIG